MYTSVQFKCLLAHCLNINGVLINFSSSRERERKPSLSHLCSPSLPPSVSPRSSLSSALWRRIAVGKETHFPRGVTSNLTCPYRFHIQHFSSALEGTSFSPCAPTRSDSAPLPLRTFLKCLSFLCFPSCLCFCRPQNDWIAFFFLIQPAITQKRRGTGWCWRLGCTETAKLKFSCSDISCLGFLTHPSRSVSVVRNHHLQSTAAQPGSVSVLTKVVWVQKGNLCGVTEVKQQFSGIKQKP